MTEGFTRLRDGTLKPLMHVNSSNSKQHMIKSDRELTAIISISNNNNMLYVISEIKASMFMF